MRNASSALTAFLLSRKPCWSADLFTISLAQGGTLYLTSFDEPITANGHVFSSNGMTIERNSWEAKNTTDVPQMEIQLYSTGTDFNGANFKQLAHEGALDGGYIELDRAFMTAPGNLNAMGTVLIFGGRISTATISATGVKLIVKGNNVLMQQYFPKNIYQLGCIHNLYDANCKANRSSFTISKAVGSSGVNAIFLPWSSAPANPSLYNLGSLTITSGAGEDQVRTVQNATSSGLTLAYPLYEIPAPGDTFSVSQGCNKTQTTCSTIFANLQNFRGFPYIPPAETALS